MSQLKNISYLLFLNKRIGVFLILLSIIIPINAQNKDTLQFPKLVFELPIIDMPYQLDAAKTVGDGNVTAASFLKGYANPSMQQTLNLSTDLYTGAHFGINKLFKVNSKTKMHEDQTYLQRVFYSLSLLATDVVLLYTPGFDGWMHEEYHRSILTRFHVNSFNDMNKFPLGAELVSVSHVKDEDLISFKQENPIDFIRTHAAGIEGEYLLIDKLQRNNFFYKQNLPHEILYLFAALNSILYVNICSNSGEADKITDDVNSKEQTIEVRDFTGLDFIAWTYDLFRPYEAYTERGIHPSGTGIDRYIKTSDLTPDELSYLNKQGNLQWINAVSPMLLGIRSIKLSENGLYGNLSMHNYLTSFGNDISCNILLMNPKYKYSFAFHSYQNFNKSFPAIEMQMVDFEQPVFTHKLYFSPRLLIGIQPLNQEFKTNNAEFLGLAECKIELNFNTLINPFLEFSAKSDGWIAGNEFLNNNISCRIGIVSRIRMDK